MPLFEDTLAWAAARAHARARCRDARGGARASGFGRRVDRRLRRRARRAPASADRARVPQRARRVARRGGAPLARAREPSSGALHRGGVSRDACVRATTGPLRFMSRDASTRSTIRRWRSSAAAIRPAGGTETAFEFARSLAERGLVITSGLAAGIDAAAHRGALAAQGLTVAVLGNGRRSHLPREQPGLGEAIVERGVLVSHFPLGTPPRRVNFPRRNRIIAALSLGTLVVEAARGSWLADHRPRRATARADRVRDPRLDSQSPEPRLPSAHQGGRSSGRKRG